MSQNNQFQSTTQKYLDIYDITNNLIILKDGTVSFVLTVSAMNFGLLAEAEQDAVIYTYAALLNSLNYPIQIVIQSQTKDATTYLNLLKIQEQKASTERKQERIARYRHFVSNLIHERNVLDKKFYVVVPASPIELGLLTADSVLPGRTEFDISKYEKSVILEKAELALEPKRDHLISQFARIGLYARQLSTQEIIRIFYTSYNPEASEGQEIADTTQYTTPLVRANLVQQTQQILSQNTAVTTQGGFVPPSNQDQANWQTNQPNQQVTDPANSAQPPANMPGAKRPQTKVGGTSVPLTQSEKNPQADDVFGQAETTSNQEAAAQASIEPQGQDSGFEEQTFQQPSQPSLQQAQQQTQPQPPAPTPADSAPQTQAPTATTNQTANAFVPEPKPAQATAATTPTTTPTPAATQTIQPQLAQSQTVRPTSTSRAASNGWTENIEDFSVDLSDASKTSAANSPTTKQPTAGQNLNATPGQSTSKQPQQQSQKKQPSPNEAKAKPNPVLTTGGTGGNPQSIIDQTLKEVKIYDRGSEQKSDGSSKQTGQLNPTAAKSELNKTEPQNQSSSNKNQTENLPPIAEIK
jgi:hypothetical protein